MINYSCILLKTADYSMLWGYCP